MRNLTLLFALLFPLSALAAPIQQTHCSAVPICAFANPVAQGDLLLAVGQTTAILTDSQINTWTRKSFQGWYGASDSLYFTHASVTGPLTVTFATAPTDVTLLEYPPAIFDQASTVALNCCNATATVGPLTIANASELLVLIVNHQTPYAYSVPGFATDDAGFGYNAMDESVSAGTYSVVVPQGRGGAWGAELFAFQSTAPPPLPVTLTFGPSTSALTPCTDTVTYDDGSGLFSQPAPESVMQLQAGAWVNIGTPVIQPNGLITGSVAINPSLTDANGFIELQLLVQTVFNIPSMSALLIAPAQLQNGATGLCSSMVMYKANQTLKYETFGLTP